MTTKKNRTRYMLFATDESGMYFNIESDNRRKLEKIANLLSRMFLIDIQDNNITDDCPTVWSNY